MWPVTTILDSTGTDTGDSAVVKTAKSPCFPEAYVLVSGEWRQTER